MKKTKRVELPNREAIEGELRRIEHRKSYQKALRSTVYSLIVVAAIAVLIATLYLPVLSVSGSSMEPNLNEGDVLVGIKSSDYEIGQICCFSYGNKLIMKRVIGRAGDWIDIDEEGYVFVNGVMIDEPYLQEHAFGICDIEFPYQVPDGCVFILGDNRRDSVDSRSSVMGCIATDRITAKILLRIWPLQEISYIK